MSLIVPKFPDVILHPAMINKWMLEKWAVNGVADSDIMTFQAITMEVIKTPTLFKSGHLNIVFEEDIGGAVAKAIEERKGRVGTVIIHVLDGANIIVKTIELHGVKIKNHRFRFDYAASETLKADLDCSFKKMVIR